MHTHSTPQPSRVIIVGKNSAISATPFSDSMLRSSRHCPVCDGTGLAIVRPFDPKVRPYLADCPCCGGNGLNQHEGEAA